MKEKMERLRGEQKELDMKSSPPKPGQNTGQSDKTRAKYRLVRQNTGKIQVIQTKHGQNTGQSDKTRAKYSCQSDKARTKNSLVESHPGKMQTSQTKPWQTTGLSDKTRAIFRLVLPNTGKLQVSPTKHSAKYRLVRPSTVKLQVSQTKHGQYSGQSEKTRANYRFVRQTRAKQ